MIKKPFCTPLRKDRVPWSLSGNAGLPELGQHQQTQTDRHTRGAHKGSVLKNHEFPSSTDTSSKYLSSTPACTQSMSDSQASPAPYGQVEQPVVVGGGGDPTKMSVHQKPEKETFKPGIVISEATRGNINNKAMGHGDILNRLEESDPSSQAIEGSSKQVFGLKPPKKPVSNFMMFLNEKRSALIKKGHSGDDAVIKAQKMWRSSSTAVKNQYQSKYEKELAKYEVRMAKYRERIERKKHEKGSSKSVSSFQLPSNQYIRIKASVSSETQSRSDETQISTNLPQSDDCNEILDCSTSTPGSTISPLPDSCNLPTTSDTQTMPVESLNNPTFPNTNSPEDKSPVPGSGFDHPTTSPNVSVPVIATRSEPPPFLKDSYDGNILASKLSENTNRDHTYGEDTNEDNTDGDKTNGDHTNRDNINEDITNEDITNEDKTNEDNTDENHSNEATSGGKYVCRVCQKTFSYIGQLKIHFEKCQDQYKCESCPVRLKNLKCLKAHKKKFHSPDSGFPCDTCDVKFSTEKKLAVHIKKEHQAAVYCPHCNAKSKNALALKKHIRQHCKQVARKGPKQAALTSQKVSKIVLFPCNECDKVYKDRSALRKHKFKHNKLNQQIEARQNEKANPKLHEVQVDITVPTLEKIDLDKNLVYFYDTNNSLVAANQDQFQNVEIVYIDQS